MASQILILAFVFSLGLAAAAFLVGRQLIATYDSEFHKHHFYYLAAFYAFAFYGIWGQVVARVLLASLGADPSTVAAVVGLVPLLSVPFLFVSWLMLIKLAYSMFRTPVHNTWMLLHICVLLLLVLGAWAAFTLMQNETGWAGWDLRYAEVVAIIALELIYFGAFLVVALRLSRHADAARRHLLIAFSLLLFVAFITRTLGGALLLIDERLFVVFVVIYFGSNLAPLLYVRAVSDRAFEPVKAEAASRQGLEQIFERYGITKRERQIIEQVCLGKTNQQVADELFISLQTVKDHTHRIYSKIGINSRLQLVQLVNSAS